jgi:predicted ATPase/class 3 adenylate cyclase
VGVRPPSGTVTFLFTDVVGSTELWESAPEAMAEAIARHDGLLHGAVDAHDGYVFATGGDGLAAAFARAGDAVQAAVDAQAALFDERWPPGVSISVRIGLHSGEADERENGFFGAAVNRAARIMSVARGGQILASAVTAALVSAVPGVELRPMGSRRLRGVSQPVDLVVVLAAGVELNATAPAVNVVEGNLPRPVTEYVGDLAELRRRVGGLSGRRLVTLTGSGGVGKTRTAIEIGWLSSDHFSGGVWLVELAPLGVGDALPAAVAATLGVLLQPGSTMTESIVAWLRFRPTLLILDNCEHVLDDVAPLVAAIEAGAPEATVLATSREPLGLAGEVVRRVPSLDPVTDAVQLFAERAASASDGFVLDNSNRAVVSAICARLDGIPLAIELAAARVRALSPVEILDRLEDRFRLLRSGARGGHERHQTLLATVTWSVQLLSPDERCLFERLSVFAGGFDLPAVHAVCGEDAAEELDTLDMLEQLVEKSLVQAHERAGRTRYSLLETMRQFGLERVAERDKAILRDRHCRHYAAMAEASWDGRVGPDDFPWQDWLVDELDNLRLAWAWALETGDHARVVSIPANLVTYAGSFPAEVWSWAEQAAALRDAEQLPFANRLFQHIAWAKLYVGEGGAIAWVRRAEGLEGSGRCRPDPGTPLVLGPALVFSGDIEGGLAASQRAEEAADAVGSDYLRAYSLYLQVYALLALGRSALDPAEKALAVALRSGNDRLRAYGLVACAVAAADDDPIRAHDLFLEARPLTQRLRLWNLYGSTVAYLPLMEADPDPTLTGLREALEVYGSRHSSFGVRNVARSWIPALAQLGRYETVALIDGVTSGFSVSIWPRRVNSAIEQARSHLGDEAYERGMARGRGYGDDELRRALLPSISQ